MPLEEVKELIANVDTDGNGLVDFEEFKEVAAKGWFVAAFQSKLIDELMSKVNMDFNFEDLSSDDDDAKSEIDSENDKADMDMDDGLSDVDKLDVISDKSNDYEELLEQTTMKTQRIQDLVHEMQVSKGQNEEISRLKTEMNLIKEMYENKLMDKLSNERMLKRKLEELQNKNHRLQDDVSVLQQNKENSHYNYVLPPSDNGIHKATKID